MPDSVNPDDTLTDADVQAMAADRARTVRVAREDRWLALRDEHDEMVRVTDAIRAARAKEAQGGLNLPIGNVLGGLIKPPKGVDLT